MVLRIMGKWGRHLDRCVLKGLGDNKRNCLKKISFLLRNTLYESPFCGSFRDKRIVHFYSKVFLWFCKLFPHTTMVHSRFLEIIFPFQQPLPPRTSLKGYSLPLSQKTRDLSCRLQISHSSREQVEKSPFWTPDQRKMCRSFDAEDTYQP